jgi:hypothetical protein
MFIALWRDKDKDERSSPWRIHRGGGVVRRVGDEFRGANIKHAKIDDHYCTDTPSLPPYVMAMAELLE